MLGLTAAASARDAAINKKILGSGTKTSLVSNDEMNDILKIVKSPGDSGVLLKGVNETIKNEVKEQKEGFLSMLLGALGASLLENMLAGKGVIRAREGTGYGSKRSSSRESSSIIRGLQAYYQNEPRFNGVYSRDNLPHKTKDGAYVINLNDYSDTGTHWITLYVNSKTVTYFDSFGIEHIPQRNQSVYG